MDDKLNFVKQIQSLPSPSKVLHKISSLIHSPDSSAADIVDALKLDPAIAGRVLRLANSAFIGIPRTVSSLQNAVVLLGSKRIHALIMASEMSLAMGGRKTMHLPFGRFWAHSIAVALCAESIARHLKRYEEIDADEVFSASLLHDIGKLVQDGWLTEEMKKNVALCQGTGIPYYKAESAELSHTMAGSALAGAWNLPVDLQLCLSHHHDPASVENNHMLVALVHVADVMAHLMGAKTFDNETPPKVDEKALERIHLPLERLGVIAKNALDDQKRIEALVEIFVSQ